MKKRKTFLCSSTNMITMLLFNLIGSVAFQKQGIDACCRNFFFLLEEMILDPDSHGLAAALYLNLSCLEEAKPILGSSETVPFLTKLLSIGEPPISETLVYQRISTPISC
ncbi:hypothetical protein Droror1_Dr00025129 [Drosera rotundifolia]